MYGALAQLIERGIRIAEVTSLNLVCSTIASAVLLEKVPHMGAFLFAEFDGELYR